MNIHQGGYLCDDARFETTGNPEASAICLCKYCQLKTASAFGTFVYFQESNFRFISNLPKTYELASESGGKWQTQFYTNCGTTTSCRLEKRQGMIGASGGTFDPTDFWHDMSREVLTQSEAHFMKISVAKTYHETINGLQKIMKSLLNELVKKK